jgi:SAM-dependent methyltransferase
MQYGSDWTKRLFIDNPKLFLPFLMRRFSEAKAQAESLCFISKELKIPGPMKILDLSCGIGGHSIFLAMLGHRLVGYDPSEFYIKKARNLAKRQLGANHNIRFISGSLCDVKDILLKEGESNFDLIINMGHSIGFGSIYDDIRIFKSLLPLSKRNTFLFVEFQNLHWVLRNFQPNIFYQFANFELYEYWKFDLENSICLNRSKYYERDRRTGHMKLILDLEMPQRYYTPHEIKSILLEAGWRFLKCYKAVQDPYPVELDSMMPLAISKNVLTSS